MILSETLSFLAPYLKWIALTVLAIFVYFRHIGAIRRADREEDQRRRVEDENNMQRVYNNTLEAQNQRFQNEQDQKIKLLRSIDQSSLNDEQRELLFTDPIRFLASYPNTGKPEKTDPGSED